MKANIRTLLAVIVALACFLPFSEVLADTLVYKGTITVVGYQTKENFTDLEPPMRERFRKRIRVIMIKSMSGPERALIYIDPRAKTFNFDFGTLTKLPADFFGVNGRPSTRASIQNFVTNNFSRDTDRDGAGGDDTNTTKAGSLSGTFRLFKIDDISVFAPKTLRGQYVTTRCSDVVSAETAGYDPGLEFTTLVERITMRINRRETTEHFSDSVSDAFSSTISELSIDDGFSEMPAIFADGFESGDTTSWTSAAP